LQFAHIYLCLFVWAPHVFPGESVSKRAYLGRLELPWLVLHKTLSSWGVHKVYPEIKINFLGELKLPPPKNIFLRKPVYLTASWEEPVMIVLNMVLGDRNVPCMV